MSEEVRKNWIASFWRRIGALFIDALMLGIIGLVLGVVFEDAFVQIGVWGRLVGFGIALIYFGVMNSKLSEGQTVGKRLLKLRVVDYENKPISLANSGMRYSVLGTPFFFKWGSFFK